MTYKNYGFFFLMTLLSVGVLSGCSTVYTRDYMSGAVSPKPSNGYRGELFAESFILTPEIASTASEVCARFGGLVPGSLKRIKVDGMRAINEPIGDYYEYKCGHGVERKRKPNYQSTAPQQPPPSQAPARNVSVDEVKRKCKELGFVEGTPEFADCGLKLMQ